MTLGRTSSGAIKIKTDGGLRAVECACCNPPEPPGYYSAGGYYCSDGSIHPIFGPQVDYWSASAYYEIGSGGIISYKAEAWSAAVYWIWRKTAPAGSQIDYGGMWTAQPAESWGGEGPQDKVFTISQGADSRCPNANQRSLDFNTQVPVYAMKWTDNGIEMCGGSFQVMVDVYGCKQ